MYGNQFKVFPMAVFKHKLLSKLYVLSCVILLAFHRLALTLQTHSHPSLYQCHRYIGSNPKMKNVTFTIEQAAFLNNLEEFLIDPKALRTDCDVSQQAPVKTLTVCTSKDSAEPNIVTSPLPTAASPATATPSSSNGSLDAENGAVGSDELISETASGTTAPSVRSSSATTSASTTTTISDGATEVDDEVETETGEDSLVPGATNKTKTVRTATISTSAAKNGTSTMSSGAGVDANGQQINTIYEKSTEKSSTTPVVLSSVGGVCFIALLAAFVYMAKIKRDHAKAVSEANSSTETGTSPFGSNFYKSLWNDPDLLAVQVSADEIRDVKMIGHGAFCAVWLVKYRTSQQLASKRLHDSSSIEHTQELIEEIKLVSTLKHAGIVQLVGAAWTQESDLQALFEYMEGGDLRSYLDSERTTRSWTLEKIQIAVDIVEALVYVHSFNPPLVHRDLKSHNILLSKDMEAKISDFGVSRYQSEQNTMTAGVGTGCWLAPEVISGRVDYGTAADIFSFGVILSELDSHRLPYADAATPSGNKLSDLMLMELVATGQLRPMLLPTCPPKIAQLADRCLSLHPEDRPTATQIAYVLRSFKKSMSTSEAMYD